MAGKYTDLIEIALTGAGSVGVTCLAAWAILKKYFKFEDATAARDAESALFKKEVNKVIAVQNKSIDIIKADVIELKTSTNKHIDAGFEKQDKKNIRLFPPAEGVYARFEKLELAREVMFKTVMTKQDVLSTKQDEISETVKLIFKKISDMKDDEIADLKRQLRDRK